MASAYPHGPAAKHVRAIDKTNWIKIDRATCDACFDARDNQPKKAP